MVSATAVEASGRGEKGAAGAGRALRVAGLSYLNTEPLVVDLAGDPGLDVERDLPAAVARRLHAGEIDLGILPSIEYAYGHYAIVPGVAIASRGPVRSVRLFRKRPLEQIRRVALDTSSRTSVALVRILLRERLGRDPEYLSMAPVLDDMLEAADAALLIGDPALAHENDRASLDLGEEWTRLTGLPFVYAFWAARPGALAPEHVRRLRRALAAGLERIGEIAVRRANGVAGQAERNASYLRDNIVFGLGEAETSGLREFYRRAHSQALIAAVPELRFHADQ